MDFEIKIREDHLSKATNKLIQEEIEKARQNIGITTIIAIGVSNYRFLQKLKGPMKDIERIKNNFTSNQATKLYDPKQLIVLADPTSHQLRECILNFAQKRAMRGDIVLFYFSGHGAVIGNGDFALCTVESTKNPALDGGILSASAVMFSDILHTFSSVDIRPFFIFDACFSGSSALEDGFQIGHVIQNEAYIFGSTYGLLCSSNPEVETKDLPEGGIFTLRFCETIEAGIGGPLNKNKPLLSISDIASSLIDRLALDGSSLPRLYMGSQLPEIAISKNVQYSPESESFTLQYKQIVLLLWNNGNPKEVKISDFLTEIGSGAYANHSKLSRNPWALLENSSSNKKRKLTEKGIEFAQGKIKIPKRIIKDPISWNWIPDPDSPLIKISDL
jgi:hypothetical protein